jgi:hypothetical protein
VKRPVAWNLFNLWLEVCKRLRVEDNVRLLAVSRVFREAVRGHYGTARGYDGTNCLYFVYCQQEMELPRALLRFGWFIKPPPPPGRGQQRRRQ